MGEGKIQKEETIEKDRKHQHPGWTHEGHTHESHAHSHAAESHCGCGHDHAHDGDSHESHTHSHAHESHCGCGHDHTHDGDGHESHAHSHAAESHCGCGHDHAHDGDGHEPHVHSHAAESHCGCGHHHEPAERRPENHAFDGVKKQIYIIENLGCANCAAKMERKIQELPQVDYANLIYATRQLQVVTNTDEELLPVFQGICASIEDGVTLTKQETKQAASERKAAEKEKARENKKDIWELGIGAVLMAAGIVTEGDLPAVSAVLLVIAYLILGRHVLLTAGKNLTKGHVFDENFLMSIATLGAFAIQDYKEAVGVMLFYRVGELFEEIAVARSRSQIMDAVDLRPEVVSLVQGSEVQVIPAEQARPGDLLLVRPGDRIPLDGTIMEGESRIDTSPVTGEPVPVAAGIGDSVISGCVNTSGLLRIRVEKALEDSMVTKILDSVENAAASKPKIDRFITRFSRIYTPIVVALAAATAILPSLVTGDWQYWVYTALTFLVISCPCALVLSVPLAFFSGIGAGSKLGILFKGGIAIEALQNVKAVVMDKTGTVTEGNFELQRILPAKGFTEEQVLVMAGTCEQNSTHPIAASIMAAVQKQGITPWAPDSVKEIAGKGIEAAAEEGTLLCGSRSLLSDAGIAADDERAGSGGTEVFLAVNGKYAGSLIIADTVKEDAKPAVTAMKRQGIVTAMLTGDGPETARAVAAETGIDEVHAKLLPEEKLRELTQIRSTHGSVMFVGDGINDAPVLAGADVGAAMGSGADAAIEAADVVFMTSAMSAIPQALSIAKATGRIARQNVIFALVIKAAVMVLGLAGLANMWMAVFADTGVAMLCILNSIRILYKKQ
ncbi:MAG: heavy metal translocating P-type ATPase [Ruminococcus sp.]|nr:heavy metal translocating P-type ATPase [Ruminococcus sp.]